MFILGGNNPKPTAQSVSRALGCHHRFLTPSAINIGVNKINILGDISFLGVCLKIVVPFAIIVTSSSSECKQSKQDTALICEDLFYRYLCIYMSCKKYNNICTVMTNRSCICSFKRYFSVYFLVWTSSLHHAGNKHQNNPRVSTQNSSALEFIHYSLYDAWLCSENLDNVG